MKIGWFSSSSPLLPTGIGKVSRYLTQGLRKMGYEVVIIDPHHGGRPIEVDGCIHYPLSDFRLFEVLLDEIRPEVLVNYNSQWAPPYNQVGKICMEKNVKLLMYCAVEWGSLSLQFLESLIGANRIATPSRHGQEVLKRHDIPTFYVPHGCDLNIYHPIYPKPEFEGARGKFVFGQVARNQLRKEWPTLLQAFSHLPSHIKERSILYCHTMPWEESGGKPGWNFPELILRFGLQGKVLMPSGKAHMHWGLPEEEMAQLYNAMHCHCLISSGEGFGLPILESMACGVPNIASNNTAIPEVMGGGGVLVDCWDEEQYTAEGMTISTTKISSVREAMIRIFEDDELRKELSEKGIEQALKFSWGRAVAAMAHAIEETRLTEDRLDNRILRFPEPIESSAFVEKYAELVPPGEGKLLDLGCGPEAPYRGYFTRLGYKWVGIDKKGGNGVLELDIAQSELPFEDKEFSFAFLCHLIEHIPTERQAQVLSEARRVAHHGVVIFPMEESLAFWLDKSHHRLASEILAQKTETKWGCGIIRW